MDSGESPTSPLPATCADRRFVSGSLVGPRAGDHLAEVPGLLTVPDEPNGAAVVMRARRPHLAPLQRVGRPAAGVPGRGRHRCSPNYRGSDGYGRTWQLANRWLMGQGELLDWGGRHASWCAMGCDPDRIAVTGRSHGGYMTMACLTHYPELWACGRRRRAVHRPGRRADATPPSEKTWVGGTGRTSATSEKTATASSTARPSITFSSASRPSAHPGRRERPALPADAGRRGLPPAQRERRGVASTWSTPARATASTVSSTGWTMTGAPSTFILRPPWRGLRRRGGVHARPTAAQRWIW